MFTLAFGEALRGRAQSRPLLDSARRNMLTSCRIMLFIHVERTGGTSVRSFVTHQRSYEFVGQFAPHAMRNPARATCTPADYKGGPKDLLKLLSDPTLASRNCTLFAELHNSEWRVSDMWVALVGLRALQRRMGCRVTFWTILRDPFEQVLSELLYFNPLRLNATDQRSPNHMERGIRELQENMLVKLALLHPKMWLRAAPSLSSSGVLDWARIMCQRIALLDDVAFTDSLSDDFERVKRAQGIIGETSSASAETTSVSASPSLEVGTNSLSGGGSHLNPAPSSNANASPNHRQHPKDGVDAPLRLSNSNRGLHGQSIVDGLLAEHAALLSLHNRLSRVTYNLLGGTRERRQLWPLAARCEEASGAVSVPRITSPPRPPPSPPPPPCVATNESGCRADRDCCEFSPYDASMGRERKPTTRAYCEYKVPGRRERGMACYRQT